MSVASLPDRNSEDENCVEAQVIITASAKDQHIFFDAIINPPMPSRQLQAAVKKYRQMKVK